MFENPRRGRQARNFTTNVPKILDLKSSSEQIFSRKLSLGAPVAFQGIKTFNMFPINFPFVVLSYREKKKIICGVTIAELAITWEK